MRKLLLSAGISTIVFEIAFVIILVFQIADCLIKYLEAISPLLGNIAAFGLIFVLLTGCIWSFVYDVEKPRY